MDAVNPGDVVVLAGSDPQTALTQAERLLGDASLTDRVILLHAQGVAHRNLRNPDMSVQRLEAALDAGAGSDATLVWSIRADLAVSLGDLGSPEAGLRQLDEFGARTGDTDGEDGVDAPVVAKVWHARGLLLQRMGRPGEALDCYGKALPRYQEADDHLRIGQVNTNLALLNAYEGDIDAALSHLDQADEAFTLMEDEWWVAVSMANRGWVLGCSGRLPRALQLMSEADQRLNAMEMPDGLRVVSKAEVLLKGGLHGPARRELDRAIAHFDERHQGTDLSEALILAAQAAALDGDPTAALHMADRACDLLSDQQRPGWAAAARAMRFGLQCRVGAAPDDLVAAIADLRAALATAGHRTLVPSVILNGAWAFLDRGDVAAAQTLLRDVDGLEGLTTDDAAVLTLNRARIARSVGDLDQALGALEHGFDHLEGELRTLGGIDMAALAAGSLSRIINEAKDLLAGSSDGRRFLDWADRGRQIATWRWPRLENPEIARLLNRVRALESRSATGSIDPAEHAVLSAVKDEIRELRWQAETSGSNDGARPAHPRQPHQPPAHTIDLTRVGAAWYVTTVEPTGGADAVLHDLVDLSRDQLEAALRISKLFQTASPAIRGALAGQLDELLDPVNRSIVARLPESPTEPVVLGIDDELADIPWSSLPALWNRPFSILPTQRSLVQQSERISRRDVLSVVVGPGLASGGEESTRVEASAKQPVAVARVRDMEELGSVLNSRLVHIAAHGGPEPDNPLFTWLEFDFGRVFLHDLMFLDAVPETVVLAACYAGQNQQIGAGGSASFANGFLGVGSRWVVAASTALSDDEELIEFAADAVARISAGVSPPVALAEARTSLGDPLSHPVAAAFTCYGG